MAYHPYSAAQAAKAQAQLKASSQSPTSQARIDTHARIRAQRQLDASQSQPLPRNLAHPELSQLSTPTAPQASSEPRATGILPLAAPFRSFLDTTFRSYAERIQAEFTSLRSVCARALSKEHHEKEVLKAVCSRLQHERNLAEGKVHVLLGRREAERRRHGNAIISNQIEIPRGIKRAREEDVQRASRASSSSSSTRSSQPVISMPAPASNVATAACAPRTSTDSEDSAHDQPELSSPSPSPVSSPLPLSRSPPHVPELQLPVPAQQKRGRSQPLSELPADLTGFDLTVLAPLPPTEEIVEEGLPLAKRRRVSGGSEMSDRTVVEEEDNRAGTPSSAASSSSATSSRSRRRRRRRSVESQVECNMEMESDTDTDVVSGEEEGSAVEKENSSKCLERTTPSPSPRITYEEDASTRSRLPTPTPTHLDLEHVDIMYIPVQGRLVCRVCLYVLLPSVFPSFTDHFVWYLAGFARPPYNPRDQPARPRPNPRHSLHRSRRPRPGSSCASTVSMSTPRRVRISTG